MTNDLWPLLELVGELRRRSVSYGPSIPCPHCRARVPLIEGRGYFPNRRFTCYWCSTDFSIPADTAA